MAQPGPICILETLTEQVRTWVPENLFTNFVFKSNQLHQAVSFQGTGHIHKFKVKIFIYHIFCLSCNWALSEGWIVFFGVLNPGYKGCLSQILWYAFSNADGSRQESLSLDLLAIFESNGDLWFVYVGKHIVESLLDEFKKV